MDIVMYLDMINETNLWEYGSTSKDWHTRRKPGVQILCAFKAQHGHCNVSRYDKRNKSLGIWVNQQRSANKKKALSSSR
eukprot:5796596-Ditylum_brightwellii.AAC.1